MDRFSLDPRPLPPGEIPGDHSGDLAADLQAGSLREIQELVVPQARVAARGRSPALVLAALGGLLAMGLGSALVQRTTAGGPVPIALDGAVSTAVGAPAAPGPTDAIAWPRTLPGSLAQPFELEVVAAGSTVSATIDPGSVPAIVRASVVVGGLEIGVSERAVSAPGPAAIVVPVAGPPFDVAAELVVAITPGHGRTDGTLVRRTFQLRPAARAGLLGIQPQDGPSGTALVVHAFVPASAALVDVSVEDESGVVLASAAARPGSATLWGGLLVGTVPVSATLAIEELAPGSRVALDLAWDDADGRQTLRRLLVVPDPERRPDASSDRP